MRLGLLLLALASTVWPRPSHGQIFASPSAVASGAMAPAALVAPTADDSSLVAVNLPEPFVLDETCDCCASPACGDCLARHLTPFFGYDSWRGVADGTWQHNGLHAGANFGTRLGAFSDWTGIGLQAGGSAGVYDWAGTDYRMHNADETLTQGFLTYGLFRRATEGSPWSAAIVHDWMFSDNFSVFGQDPTLSQWRGQIGYAIGDWQEVGVWGAFRGQGDQRDVPGWGPVAWRSINQLSAFWHTKWSAGGADTTIWVGVPENDRLTGDGSLNDYFVGALANMPLGDRVAVYSSVTYLHPSASAGATAAKEDAWVFVVGLTFYPRGQSHTATVRGHRWSPLLPVTNNGLFLIDASANY